MCAKDIYKTFIFIKLISYFLKWKYFNTFFYIRYYLIILEK